MAAEIGVQSVYTVASDKELARIVRIQTRRSFPKVKLAMKVVDVGEFGRWSAPIDDTRARHWTEYSLAIWDTLDGAGEAPATVLIDGRFRVACFLASLIRAAPGTKILFDDYVGREKKYGVAEKYAGIQQTIEKMVVFEVPASKPDPKIAFDLAQFPVDPT